jgi:hypothetical protein
MNNFIAVAESLGTDLCGRNCAVGLRNAITAAIDSGEPSFVVDLTGVRTLSHSFADEAFAILIADRGEDWFARHVIITGHSSVVRTSILAAVAERIDAALLATA